MTSYPALVALLLTIWLLPTSQAHENEDELNQYFFAAARVGNTEVLETFLHHGYPVNAINEQSYTALMVATYYGQLPAVQLLLAQGADRCIRDKRGHTAMMGAVVKAEWRIARELHKVDCDSNAGQSGALTLAEFAEVFGQSERLAVLQASQNEE